jgi:hypothetical protein
MDNCKTVSLSLPDMIGDLLNDLETFDESMFTPPRPVEPHEKVIGDCDEWTRKCFALLMCIGRDQKHAATDFEFISDDSPSAKQMHDDIHRLQLKGEVLDRLLWLYLRSKTDQLCSHKYTLGIRRGWKIVQFEEQPEMPDIIKRILGQS